MTMVIHIRRKVFPARDQAPERLVYEDFYLTLGDGEVCAITGPSGIGKSSLLQIAAGLDRAFEGEITGRPEPVGYLFQTPRLLPWRTARENLELVLPGHPDEAASWMKRIGLGDTENVYPQRLSVGMARRVSLARALAVEPRLLLLDEPFSALDETTAHAMQNLIADCLTRSRPTTLLVTHSWQEAVTLADRIVVLDGSPARIAKEHWGAKRGAAE